MVDILDNKKLIILILSSMIFFPSRMSCIIVFADQVVSNSVSVSIFVLGVFLPVGSFGYYLKHTHLHVSRDLNKHSHQVKYIHYRQ